MRGKPVAQSGTPVLHRKTVQMQRSDSALHQDQLQKRKSEMVAEAVRRATEQGFQNDARMPCTPCAARQALGSAYAGGKRLPCFLRSFASGDLVRRRRMHVIGTNHRGGLKKR